MEVLSIQNQFQCSQYAVEDWPPKTSSSSSPASSLSPLLVTSTGVAAAPMPDPAVSTTQKPYDRQQPSKLQAKQKSPSNGQERRRYNTVDDKAVARFNYNNNSVYLHAPLTPYSYVAPAPQKSTTNINHTTEEVDVGDDDGGGSIDDAAAAAAAGANTTATSIAADPTNVSSVLGASGCCHLNSLLMQEISLRLQAELRMAKNRHLTCTEVSLPWELTPRIALEIIKVSEREPCGVRGSTIFIEFEHEPNNVRRIASFKVDPNTLSTFELYVTLKQDKSGWISRLPQFLKNLTRCSTILISPEFTLTKNKLYSCE